jgi:protein arginine N-methyltransferase 1
MSLIVDEHRLYLSDAARLSAFRAALAAVVRRGDVVADVGSGTGVLAWFACAAGARRVYAIESTGMIELARALAAENGLADRIVFIPRHSSEAAVPEPVDVLVGDLAGRMGFEAGVFEVYRDARRWLKPDARVIPSTITIHAAPVEHRAAHDDAVFWRDPIQGFRAESALRWALNTGYPHRYERAHLLANATVSATYPTLDPGELLRLDGEIAIDRPGVLHGIGAWFEAAMAPGVTMTNAPGASSRINRRNVFLPLERPVTVAPGDPVSIAVRIRHADMLVSWSVRVTTAEETRQERHSTLEGMLVTREEVRAHDPRSRPGLTPRGVARKTVLDLCDGRHALADIERDVQRRHPDLFATAAEAQLFVAEVVTRYGVVDGEA